MMQLLHLEIGPNAFQCTEKLDSQRISIANKRAQEAKEARKLKRAKKEANDIAKTSEDLM